MKETAAKANIADFIESMPQGYDTDVNQRGVNLSGGQKQRIAIARALAKNATVMILDDATSAVDMATEKKRSAHPSGKVRPATTVLSYRSEDFQRHGRGPYHRAGRRRDFRLGNP